MVNRLDLLTSSALRMPSGFPRMLPWRLSVHWFSMYFSNLSSLLMTAFLEVRFLNRSKYVLSSCSLPFFGPVDLNHCFVWCFRSSSWDFCWTWIVCGGSLRFLRRMAVACSVRLVNFLWSDQCCSRHQDRDRCWEFNDSQTRDSCQTPWSNLIEAVVEDAYQSLILL